MLEVDVNALKSVLQKKVDLGVSVQETVASGGYQILKAVFHNFIEDVKAKSDYTTLEAFKSDRKAIEIIQGMFSEFEGFVSNADQAVSELKKITEADSSTPSLLSLDGEGEDTEEGQP